MNIPSKPPGRCNGLPPSVSWLTGMKPWSVNGTPVGPALLKSNVTSASSVMLIWNVDVAPVGAGLFGTTTSLCQIRSAGAHFGDLVQAHETGNSQHEGSIYSSRTCYLLRSFTAGAQGLRPVVCRTSTVLGFV